VKPPPFLNLSPVPALPETGKLALKPGMLGCLVSLLLGLFFCGGCGTKQNRASVELPIFFTCDTRGRLEPCGCFEGQFGGLTRLKTVLDAIAPTNALRVDVGDAIGGREDYDLIEYTYMLRAFAAMNYDALNPGHREAQLAVTQLHAIKQTSPVPLVSANLLDQTTGRPIFDSWRIIERGGFRIALIGVVDPSGMSEPLGAGVRIGDMESALTRAIAEVRPKSDLIVLLAFADEEALAKLARRFYEAHLILGGKVRQPAQELRKENRSLIYFVTNESRAFGMLRLLLVDGASPAALAHEIRLLHDQIPQDRSFRELAQTYRDEVRHTRLNVDDPAQAAADAVPGVRSPAKYVGSAGCVVCHPSAAFVWAKSGHAHAFATLQKRQADADPKCIACHTVGFGTPTGYRREFGAGKLVHVGCESCHGPGSLHVERRLGNSSIEFTYRPLDAGDCQKCHYGEFSRPFDWEKFWPPIKHGKEPPTAITNRALK
jgi:hypothetical protein